MARSLLLALVGILATAGPAAARNPRLEHLALRPADMALAKRAVVQKAELGTQWHQVATASGDEAAPDCPWQNYSRYTITGQSETHFENRGAAVHSRVELYPSHAQALGDFGVDARPGTAACEGKAIRKQVAKGSPSLKVSLVSAKQVPGPKVGDRSIEYKIELALKAPTGTVHLYVDLIGFVRGRAAASVVVVSPIRPLAGGNELASLVDGRLQGGVA